MEIEKVILVTGGSGLVGNGIKSAIEIEDLSYILSYLNPQKTFKVRWIFLSSKDGDLSDIAQTEKIFNTYKPTHVIHLAAIVGGLFYNMKANLDFFRKNMLINDNVLQMSFKYNVQKVISCLSSCIFPHEISSYPITEDMVHNGKPHNSNFGYSYAKRMIDVMNQAYQEIIDKSNLHVDTQRNKNEKRIFTSIIPCNVYGPHDNFDLEKGHVIPNLIHKAYLFKKENQGLHQKFNLIGTGRARRQFIYSTDLGKLLIWAIFNYEEKEPIILSVDEQDEISIHDAAQIILKSMNLENQITYSSSTNKKNDGQIKKTVSNEKIKKYLPDFKFTPIEIGIKNTIEWFEKINDSGTHVNNFI
jgi:GDP-L-fucose synthase